MTEPAKLRLFYAVDIPRECLERANRGADPLREEWPDARWTPLENQHVTLKFLGWAAEDALDDICSVGREVAGRHQPSSLRLGGLGSFPSNRRVRVLWVGMDDPKNLLAGLAMDLDRSLEPLGFTPEEREFRAHLTLARLKTPRRPSGELPDVPIGDPFHVAGIVLYRSHLSSEGPRYEALARFALGSGGRTGPRSGESDL